MDNQELQKLRDLPIVRVAERLGLQVNAHRKCLCPFHDDHHASMSFNLSRNTCRCFACMDKSLGTIDLVMRHLGKGFKEACKWLADENNIILSSEDKSKPSPVIAQKPFDASRFAGFFMNPCLSAEARTFLFDERCLDPRVIRWCRVSSWRDRNGTNWLQTPYFDADWKLIGVQNRNLKKGELPRFRFPSGSQCGIYNLPVIRMLKPGEELWITEGCSDCWAMLSAGHKAIAIPSATLLSPTDKKMLAEISSAKSCSFHMYPDKDAPGERLFLQLKEILPDLQHHHLPATCKDYADYYLLQKKELYV